MREIRLYGSEGGGTPRFSLPLLNLRVIPRVCDFFELSCFLPRTTSQAPTGAQRRELRLKLRCRILVRDTLDFYFAIDGHTRDNA